jgi:hypothetical protein
MRIAETGEINALPHTSSKMSVGSQGAERSGGYAVRCPGHEAITQRTTRGRGSIVNAQMCR